MRGHIRTRIAAGTLTALVGVALALPALGAAAPAPLAPVASKPGGSASAAADVAVKHAQAAGEAAVAAEVKLAAEKAAQAAAAYTAKKPASRKAAAKKPARRPTGNEASRAKAILASLKAKYPRYLSGVTVSIGSARGYQAISYYTTGQIVISPTHRASLERILGHEIWHIIDWRDNGRINWGERIPPANAGSYR